MNPVTVPTSSFYQSNYCISLPSLIMPSQSIIHYPTTFFSSQPFGNPPMNSSSAINDAYRYFWQPSLFLPPAMPSSLIQAPTLFCSICLQMFTNFVDLSLHINVHHRPMNNPIHMVENSLIKDETITERTKKARNTSTTSISPSCICRICGKKFSRNWLLEGHIRTHTGEKPFKCTICAKAFADKSNLRAHIQTHSTARPYCCERCGKCFALKSYLTKHEESTCIKSNKNKLKSSN